MIRVRLYDHIRNGLVDNEDERWGGGRLLYTYPGAGNTEERERKGGYGLRLRVASFP